MDHYRSRFDIKEESLPSLPPEGQMDARFLTCNTLDGGECKFVNQIGFEEHKSNIVREKQREYDQELKTFDNDEYKAFMARAAYPGNWEKAGYSDRRDLPGTSWKYRKELSDDRRAVWVNEVLKMVVISYRGTNFMADGMTYDLATDVQIATNTTSLSPMYAKDQTHYDLVKSRYPNYSFEVVGHSLGGHRAYVMSKSREIPGFGISTGSTPLRYLVNLPGAVINLKDSVQCMLFPDHKRCQFRSVRVQYDPVSISSYLMGSTETRAYDKGDRGVGIIGVPFDAHTDGVREAFKMEPGLMVCSKDGSFCI
jgi:hypothetical protein